MRALLVYPTHRNLAEEFERYESAEIDVAVYPPRTTSGTKLTEINCWNEDADRAEAVGFPVGRTVCVCCPHRDHCLVNGYLQMIITAEEADLALATHARLEHTGFDELARERDWISIHENPIKLLAPTVFLDPNDLKRVCEFLTTLLSDPRWLDWFGEDHSKDADGNVVEDQKKRVQRERYFKATSILTDLVEELQRTLTSVTQTTEWEPIETIAIPAGFERFLWWSSRVEQLHLKSAPWKFLLPALNGTLQRSTIVVTERHLSGMPQGTTKLIKTVMGVRENRPRSGVTAWFCDATLTKDRLETVLGRPVTDATPNGRIAEKKFSFQYVRDITRQTSIDVTVSLIRGVLTRHQHYQRIGVITHRPQLTALGQLEDLFRKRIVMSTYFGSGEERSSNAWYRECDLIFILGTPRVPPQSVREYLIQVGEQDVACTEPKWNEVLWQATTHRGEVKTFSGRGYYEERWRTAHRDLVRAALIQAIGRGRTVLEDGCDVIVLTNEECGLMVIDDVVPRIGDSAMLVLGQMQDLTMEKSNRALLENIIVSTSELSRQLPFSEVRVRELLRELESLRLIQRHGQRSGWKLTSPPNLMNSHSSETHKEVSNVPCR